MVLGKILNLLVSLISKNVISEKCQSTVENFDSPGALSSFCGGWGVFLQL